MQDSPVVDESVLIEKAKAGNHDSFLELTKIYDRTIRRLSSVPNIASQEKEDLYQEGLIGLYKAVITFDPSCNVTFSTFAGVCIKHSIISALRVYYSKKNYPILSSLQLDFEEDDIAKIQGLGLITEPEKVLIEKEEYETLMSKIDKELSQYERKVFKLFLQGLSYGNISKSLQTSTKSVDNAIQRIRGKLKLLIG